MDAGGVVIQPVDEDDGGNELSTRRLAGVRFERNNRLISDLFSPSIVTDTRTVRDSGNPEKLGFCTKNAHFDLKILKKLGKIH